MGISLVLFNLLLDLAGLLGKGLERVLVGRILVLEVWNMSKAGYGLQICLRRNLTKNTTLNLPCCFLILASWALAMMFGRTTPRGPSQEM